MKRLLLPTKAFTRSARKLTRKNPESAEDLRVALGVLTEDAFDPRLKTHKLKGNLTGSWACSGGYDLRIVFQFVKHKGLKPYSWKPSAHTTKFTDAVETTAPESQMSLGL